PPLRSSSRTEHAPSLGPRGARSAHVRSDELLPAVAGDAVPETVDAVDEQLTGLAARRVRARARRDELDLCSLAGELPANSLRALAFDRGAGAARSAENGRRATRRVGDTAGHGLTCADCLSEDRSRAARRVVDVDKDSAARAVLIAC